MMNDRQQTCLAVTISGVLWLSFGLALLFIAPAQSPIRLFGAVFSVAGLMATILGFAFGIYAPPVQL